MPLKPKDASESRTRILKLEEVNKFLEDSTATEFAQKAIEPLDNVRQYLEGLKKGRLLPGVADVTLRVTTFHAILDAFWRKTQEKYDGIIQFAGENIGSSFGEELIKFLRENGQLPQNEQVLLRVWGRIDSNAGWGDYDIHFSQTDKNISIDLKNSIFTRGLTDNRHRHCKFSCGYINGVLWSLLKTYYRWFREEVRPLEPMFEPISVEEILQNDENHCHFEIKLKEEELQDAFDRLYDAKMAFSQNNLTESAAKLRSSLESAYKQRIGLSMDDRTSLSTLIKACKVEEVKLPHEKTKDMYNALSRIIHEGEPNLEKFKSYLLGTENSLRSLEELHMDENSKACVKNKAREIRQSSSEEK
jgi:predicted hydrocarbon binding protein